ncbi:outer membrane lipoprotein-sorting protein [Limnochorda pilosa]|uniref:Uncharacterized protein TP-0789 domain-containing protein n=1 Tax=Limnochorda pilosa TaxID=1555112 RepID=A0A0K2SMZ4_LIMPI|nr:outer membrane lipoprotein-sorting protein [Limnochorda pilosa]BAS28486.1 hypothetical protein LIP_2656 [Limnochorda pilosa]
MFRRNRLAALLLAVLVTLAPAWAGAQQADPLTGPQILERVKGDSALSTQQGMAQVRLTTVNPRGEERPNEMRIFVKDSGDATEQLLEYVAPADVAGTKLYTRTPEKGDPDILLWLPALGRERRVAAADRGKNFMNTDFTYDEITSFSQFTEHYTAERLPDAEWDGRPAYVLKLTPKAQDSPYAYLRMYVWKDEFVPLRIDFHNLDGVLWKQLLNSNFQQNADGNWEARHIEMVNVLGKTKTVIDLIATSRTDVPANFVRELRR